MDILQAAVGCDDGKVYKLDVLETAGRRWIVTRWISKRTYRRPARLICLEAVSHQTIGNVYADPPHIVVNTPLPRDVLFGTLPSGAAEEFGIIKRTRRRYPVEGFRKPGA